MTLRGRQICSSGLQLFISPLKSHLMQLQQSRRAPASASLDPVFRLTIGTGDTFIARRPISLRAAPKHVQSYSACHFPPESPRRPLAVSNHTTPRSPSKLNIPLWCKLACVAFLQMGGFGTSPPSSSVLAHSLCWHMAASVRGISQLIDISFGSHSAIM